MVYEPELKLMKFESVPDSIEGAKEARKKGGEAKCTTGVRPIDKALGGGVGAGDVCLLAAPPGAGKTELAVQIATHNAAQGKHVHLFALEAEPHEITQRLQYREVANLFFAPGGYRLGMLGKKLNYCDWVDGKLTESLGDIEEEAERIVRDKYKTLHVYYRVKEFDLDELTRQILAVKDQTDLIILDHIHVVDLPDGPSENKAMSDLVKAIRDIALISLKPIVVVAHVRKRDSRAKTLLPDLDDVHGTSNLGKIATKAIMIAPCFEMTNKPGEYYTYMRVVKNRRDGSRCRYTAVCTFDTFQNRYKDEFILGRITRDGQEFEPLKDDEMPYWIKD
jgi:RecA/RadA recombinase